MQATSAARATAEAELSVMKEQARLDEAAIAEAREEAAAAAAAESTTAQLAFALDELLKV
jgi:hypothetical protein